MVRSLLLLILLASPVLGDEVELKNGNVLQGKVTDLGDSIRLTRNGASIVIPKNRIQAIRPGKIPEEIYAERSRALSEDDLEGHLALARWCRDQKLKKETQHEFQVVLGINPDHEEARKALGYQKVKDTWMTFEEIQKEKGLVKFRGKWITPGERDLQLALEKQKALEKEITRQVRKWLAKTGASSEKTRVAAKERLSSIEDRYKSEPYIRALASSSREKRTFVISELGRMKEPAAAKGLARRVVWDKVPELRLAALEALLSVGHDDAPLFLAAWLKEDSVHARIRAEEALGRFSDLRTVLPLLGLLSRVTRTIQWLEQYQKQISRTLRGSLLLRDGRRIRIPPDLLLSLEGFLPQDRKNLVLERDTLIASLRTITGKDFGEDISGWNNWYRKNQK